MKIIVSTSPLRIVLTLLVLAVSAAMASATPSHSALPSASAITNVNAIAFGPGYPPPPSGKWGTSAMSLS